MIQNQAIRIFAAFGLALFGVTWKLWTPQTVFPQIPFFGFLVDVPGWVDWIAFGSIITGLLVLLITGPSSASTAKTNKPVKTSNTLRDRSALTACLVFCAGLIVSILLNQHRLQPWAYHLLIFTLLIGISQYDTLFNSDRVSKSPNFVAFTKDEMLKLMRITMISIYFFSAISKFDYQFVHTIGLQMLDTILGFGGQSKDDLSTTFRSALVLLFPIGELVVAACLFYTRSRTILNLSIIAAVGLHLTLILILGPLGLGHKPAVLIWNLLFAFQVVWLFWGSECTEDDDEPDSSTEDTDAPLSYGATVVMIFMIFVFVFPMTQWIGICDHWPGWQVYSPSSSRAKLIGERSLSEWSLEELAVPVYPQARFQLGALQAIQEKENRRNGFQIEVSSQSNRFTGKRKTETLTSIDQIKMSKRKYWLNTKARSIW